MSQGASYSSGPGFAHPSSRLFLSWLLEFTCRRQKVKSHMQKDEPWENFCKMGTSLPEAVWEGTPHREGGKWPRGEKQVAYPDTLNVLI